MKYADSDPVSFVTARQPSVHCKIVCRYESQVIKRVLRLAKGTIFLSLFFSSCSLSPSLFDGECITVSFPRHICTWTSASVQRTRRGERRRRKEERMLFSVEKKNLKKWRNSGWRSTVRIIAPEKSNLRRHDAKLQFLCTVSHFDALRLARWHLIQHALIGTILRIEIAPLFYMVSPPLGRLGAVRLNVYTYYSWEEKKEKEYWSAVISHSHNRASPMMGVTWIHWHNSRTEK